MDQDPEAIKRDIDETRARMGETVEALAYKTDVPARAKDAVNDRVEGIRGAIAGVVDSAKGALGGATASAHAATADAVASVQSSATDAVTQARAILPSGAGTTERFNGVRSLAERNPLGLGIGAIAAGFLIGLLLPVSDIERDQVGPLGEQMAGGAKAAADEAIEHGKATITQAVGDVLQGKVTPTS
jgi:hypothetical protein